MTTPSSSQLTRPYPSDPSTRYREPSVDAPGIEVEVAQVDTITVTGADSAYTLTVSYPNSAVQTTASLAATADAPTVQAALAALPNVGVGNVHVTGGPGNSAALTVTFDGDLTGVPVTMTRAIATVVNNEVDTITITAPDSTFTITCNVNGQGAQTTSALAYNASATAVQAALVLLSHVGAGGCVVTGGPGDVGGTTPYTLTFAAAAAGLPVVVTATAIPIVTNEVDSIKVDATSGNFTVTVGANTTPSQAFNVLAATLQTAIRALASVGAGNCNVTGGPGDSGGTTPYVLTFVSGKAGTPLAVSATTVDLAGGGAAVTRTRTATGYTSPITAVPARVTTGYTSATTVVVAQVTAGSETGTGIGNGPASTPSTAASRPTNSPVAREA